MLLALSLSVTSIPSLIKNVLPAPLEFDLSWSSQECFLSKLFQKYQKKFHKVVTFHRNMEFSRSVVKCARHTDRLSFLRGHSAFWECTERLLHSVRNGLPSAASWDNGKHLHCGALQKSVLQWLLFPFPWSLRRGRRCRRREANAEGFCGASCNCPSWNFTGSKNHRKTDSDDKADWKRSLWRSLDGKVAWRKGSRESVFYHGGGQLVQRNRNLPNCPDEAWKYSWWVKLERIIW